MSEQGELRYRLTLGCEGAGVRRPVLQTGGICDDPAPALLLACDVVGKPLNAADAILRRAGVIAAPLTIQPWRNLKRLTVAGVTVERVEVDGQHVLRVDDTFAGLHIDAQHNGVTTVSPHKRATHIWRAAS